MGSEALLQQLAEELQSQGKRPYCIPVGGSSPLGCWGYLEAIREIQEQAGDLGITDIALVGLLGRVNLVCMQLWMYMLLFLISPSVLPIP